VKVCYTPRNFSTASRMVIDSANEIIDDYAAQGFDLTLRQLYYQFVSRDLIPNTDREYKRLGSIINDARLAGLVDWEAISDRTRNLMARNWWASPGSVIESAAIGYHRNYWKNQPYRPEVWIEKDALLGVIEPVCDRLDVPYFSCRGYTSQSEMWRAAMRLENWSGDGQTPIIFHLGDHDPSGMDMTRDIGDRLDTFLADCEVRRLALSMEQVQEYTPPPNPAKTTDSRFAQYVQLYGDESWELDALEPQVLSDLIEDAVNSVRDDDLWDETVDREREEADLLKLAARRGDEVGGFLRNGGTPAPSGPGA